MIHIVCEYISKIGMRSPTLEECPVESVASYIPIFYSSNKIKICFLLVLPPFHSNGYVYFQHVD